MKFIARSIALTIAFSLVLSGPWARLAPAQQSTQPALMQEALKTSQQNDPETIAWNVGAGLANIGYMPGKLALCGLGALAGVGLMAISVGSGYKAAAAVAEDGCGGKWVLRGDDLRPAPSTEESERPGY